MQACIEVPSGVIGHRDHVGPVANQLTFIMEEFSTIVGSLQVSSKFLTFVCFIKHSFLLASFSEALKRVFYRQLLRVTVAGIQLENAHAQAPNHITRIVGHPPLGQLVINVELLLEVDVQHGGDGLATVLSQKRAAVGGPPARQIQENKSKLL